jgi:hypothetical protein
MSINASAKISLPDYKFRDENRSNAKQQGHNCALEQKQTPH